MKLTNPDEGQITSAFAERVAEWKCEMIDGAWSGDVGVPAPVWTSPEGEVSTAYFIPPFTRSADAVLPFLEKWRDKRNCVSIVAHPLSDGHSEWVVDLIDNSTNIRHVGMDRVLARAIVLELLPHYGVEVEFTA